MKKLCINGQWRNKLILLWMLRAKTILPALTSAQWYYQKSINGRIYGCKLRNEKKFIPSALRIFTAHIYIGSIIVNWKTRRRSNTLKGSQRMGGGRIFLKIFRASLTGTSCSKTCVSGIFISFSWHVLWKMYIYFQKWIRSSRMVRASDCHCRSRNSPGFDPSILRIWNLRCGRWSSVEYSTVPTRKKIQKIPLLYFQKF